MAYTTNVPSPTFGADGYSIPSEQQILAGVQADQSEAFGGNLNPALTTPQGQLATTETAVINDANEQFLFICNNVDPAYASGRMQDAIGRIYFLSRIAAASTVVTATCLGLPGTVIPIGAQAQDQAGNIYLSTETGTIPSPSTFTGTIALTVLTIHSTVSGTVAVGQELTGAGVLPGTVITGGAGVLWTVNQSQTIGPVAMQGNGIALTFANTVTGPIPCLGGHPSKRLFKYYLSSHTWMGLGQQCI